ncbi:putative bifunctional diguanylate cyclase/phosphodiesterase [Mucisphaera calidilacus]|uniref:Phytochrome-like protein cph2 n=1 Tax=Mucisphaera calidilacus TaxID=2527982 RepID=A0A518BYB7_9BACT|nr:EAL domain-containing protein [Mucisphaera calidilacus]QDU71962.1 Phytochrome-like protein cph2 [Mucisphaera calidilacus]
MNKSQGQRDHQARGPDSHRPAPAAGPALTRGLERAGVGQALIERDGTVRHLCQTAQALLGPHIKPDTNILFRMPHDERQLCLDWLAADNQQTLHTLQLTTPDDEHFAVTLLPPESDQPALALIQEQPAEGHGRLALARKVANDGLWDWDVTHDTLEVSQRWRELLRLPDGHPIQHSRDWFSLIASSDLFQFQADLTLAFSSDVPRFMRELRMRTPEGETRWMRVDAVVIRDNTGDVTRVAGSISDIQDRKQAEHALERVAANDPLTGLASRTLFLEHVEKALERARRLNHYSFAVILLDIDHFKIVNDSLGPGSGDQLLIQIAQRLKPVLRGIDTLARLGGDEFAILLDGLDHPSSASDVARRIQTEINNTIDLDGHAITLTTSTGFVTSLHHYDKAEEMIRDADTALNQAKANGKAQAVEFKGDMHTEAYTRLVLEKELRKAVDNNNLSLAYQPIISLSDQQVVGFEALLRWNCPEHGWIPPDKFIPIAEETGLIQPIGAWVLTEACAQLKRWNNAGLPRHKPVRMNVNVSRRQLDNPAFPDTVRQIIETHAIDPDTLELEVTESVIMGQQERILDALKNLRGLGIKLAMDDFGTGYSSLSCLHEYPFDVLKIDRSFTMVMQEKRQISAVIQAIVSLAHTLDIEVVAEGIETDGQLAALQALECDLGQGFYVARPMTHEQAFDFLRNFNGFESLKASA